MTSKENKPAFVSLKGHRGKTHCYDTLEKAIEALDELGMCMNCATMVTDGRIVQFTYDAWTYRNTHERFVFLPFHENDSEFGTKLENLLKNIFAPFLRDKVDCKLFRPIFSVKHGEDFNDRNDCYFVTLLLYFVPKKDEIDKITGAIDTKLTEVEDEHSLMAGKWYCLD